MRVLGIDVGIIHLGLVLCETSGDILWTSDSSCRVLRALLVNLTSPLLGHEEINMKECTLTHSRMSCDRVDHLIQACRDTFFDVADLIVIELQPPGGIKDVEQLLVQRFRHKIRVISPIRIHRWLGIPRGMSYEDRKIRQEQEAAQRGFSCHTTVNTTTVNTTTGNANAVGDGQCDQPCLVHGTHLQSLYVPYSEQRYHDLADAFLLVKYSIQHSQTFTERWIADSVDPPDDRVLDISSASITTDSTVKSEDDETMEDLSEDLEAIPASPMMLKPVLTPSIIRFFESFRYHPTKLASLVRVTCSPCPMESPVPSAT